MRTMVPQEYIHYCTELLKRRRHFLFSSISLCFSYSVKENSMCIPQNNLISVDIHKTGVENGAYLAIPSQRYKVKLIKRGTFFKFLEKAVGFYFL